MNVTDRLREREGAWRELERLLALASTRRVRLTTADALRLAALHRAVCVDLALAFEHNLPRRTLEYLQSLATRSHGALYRSTGLDRRAWGKAVFVDAPRRLRSDLALRVSAAVFWGVFLITALLAAGREPFAPELLGRPMLEQLDQMYSHPLNGPDAALGRDDSLMAGFYIQHNTSIGLRCFAWGIVLGLGSLYELVHNAIILGTVFGYMARGPNAMRFYTFVTAHSSFELTAVVFSAAAGLRMGWGLIDTRGESRLRSLAREAANALPALGAAVVLFFLAAFVEGFVSASPIPYALKAGVALMSALLIVLYLMLGGRSRTVSDLPARADGADFPAIGARVSSPRGDLGR